MSDIKISALPAAGAAAATDSIPAVQGGVTKKETLQQIADLFGLYPAGTKVYRALLTSQDPGNPAVTVLQNTVGAIVWTRAGVGTYTGNLANAFPTNKTFFNGGQVSSDPAMLLNLIKSTTSQVSLVVTDTVNATTIDGELSETPVEILVFP